MADGPSKRIFLLKRFLHDRLQPGSTVGNSHYEWSYKENVADPMISYVMVAMKGVMVMS